MRTVPALERKNLEQIEPGELIVLSRNEERRLAILGKYSVPKDGREIPLLFNFPMSSSSASAPYYSPIPYEQKFLSLGKDYLIALNPLRRRAAVSVPRSQLLVTNARRLLCVWDAEGQGRLALNLDSGICEQAPDDYDAVECNEWEIRLKLDGRVEWSMPPIYRWFSDE